MQFLPSQWENDSFPLRVEETSSSLSEPTPTNLNNTTMKASQRLLSLVMQTYRKGSQWERAVECFYRARSKRLEANSILYSNLLSCAVCEEEEEEEEEEKRVNLYLHDDKKTQNLAARCPLFQRIIKEIIEEEEKANEESGDNDDDGCFKLKDPVLRRQILRAYDKAVLWQEALGMLFLNKNNKKNSLTVTKTNRSTCERISTEFATALRLILWYKILMISQLIMRIIAARLATNGFEEIARKCLEMLLFNRRHHQQQQQEEEEDNIRSSSIRSQSPLFIWLFIPVLHPVNDNMTMVLTERREEEEEEEEEEEPFAAHFQPIFNFAEQPVEEDSSSSSSSSQKYHRLLAVKPAVDHEFFPIDDDLTPPSTPHENYGIVEYRSKEEKGLGGTIKRCREDFIVTEIDGHNGNAVRLQHPFLCKKKKKKKENNNNNNSSLSQLLLLQPTRGQQRKGRFRNTIGDNTYVRMVVSKRGLSTFEAAERIGRALGVDVKYIRFAGLKDAYATTVQQMTAPLSQLPEQFLVVSDRGRMLQGNVDKISRSKLGFGLYSHEQILGKVASALRIGLKEGKAGLCVGDLEMVDHELNLHAGISHGNRFELILHNSEPSTSIETPHSCNDGSCTRSEMLALEKQIRDRLIVVSKSITKNGFINYYGPQRFTGVLSGHQACIASLRRDYKKACLALLQPTRPPDDLPWRSVWKATKDPQRTLHSMPVRGFTFEKIILRQLLKLSKLTKNEVLTPTKYVRREAWFDKGDEDHETKRLLIVRAYQSRLWNCAATERVKRFGFDIVKGDLLLGGYGKEEAFAANPVVFGYETSSSSSSSSSGSEKLRRGRNMISNIVLPLFGCGVRKPRNIIGSMMRRHLQHHGLLGTTLTIEIQDSGALMEPRQEPIVDKEAVHTNRFARHHRILTAIREGKASRRKWPKMKRQKQFTTDDEVVHVILGSYRHLIAYPQNFSCTVVASPLS
eukprot:jgi/Bigna1/126196/aug1.2_g904